MYKLKSFRVAKLKDENLVNDGENIGEGGGEDGCEGGVDDVGEGGEGGGEEIVFKLFGCFNYRQVHG